MEFLEDQLFTKLSGLPGSGMGLFTHKNIAAATRIAEYKGVIKLYADLTNRNYAYDIGRGYVIDAIDVTDGLAHFANDADGLHTRAGLTNNCEFQQEGMYVYLNATTDIAAGEEILVWYGEEFWAQQVQ